MTICIYPVISWNVYIIRYTCFPYESQLEWAKVNFVCKTWLLWLYLWIKPFFHLLHTPPVVLWRRNQLVTGTSQEMMPKSVNGISFCSLVSCLAVYTIWPRHRSAILTSGNQKLICKPDLDKKVHLSEYFKNRCLI